MPYYCQQGPGLTIQKFELHCKDDEENITFDTGLDF